MRLPTHWEGIDGRIAEAFNEALSHEDRITREVTRLSVTVGKEGRLRQRMSVPGAIGGWADKVESLNALLDDLVRPTTDVARTIGAVAKGDLGPVHGARGGRPPAEGRVPALGEAREYDDRAAVGVHLGSDARGARGRHRRQARRPGAGEGRVGRLEGTHRVREPDGRQPHRAGAQHRRRDHRGGQRRPVQEDHGGRARRNSAAEGSHQHDGGPASLVRVGSDARGARGGNRRTSRRPGRGARCRGHLEGSHRLGERDGDQPHRAGAQHRAGDHGRGARRPVAQDHGGREGRNSRAEGNHQHDGGPAQRLRLGSDARGARSGHGRQARRPGGGGRRGRHVEGSDRLRELDGVEPHRPGAQHRRRDHGRGARRPVAQDHGGREGRDSGAEEHHQHDGGPAQRLRVGSDARGARSGHRRQARRPGRGAAVSPAPGRI